MPFSKIVVAYDGSKAAEKALHQAIMLSQDTYSTILEIIHVYNFPTIVIGEAIISPAPNREFALYNAAQSVADRATELVKHLPLASVILKQGDPAKTILEYADETGCDLIIIGSHGHGSILDIVLGSVSHDVIKHANVSVLVVK